MRLTSNGGYKNSSSVQLSPYVFVTAAHTIWDRTNSSLQAGKFTVYPHYKIPAATSPVKVNRALYHPDFATAANDASSRGSDIGFFRFSSAIALGQFPVVFLANSGAAIFDINYSYVGNPAGDPYYFIVPPGLVAVSPFMPNSLYAVRDSFGTITTPSAVTIGYPDQVSGTNNIVTNNPYIMIGQLQGFPLGNELTVPCGNCLQVIGGEWFVSPGNSGGPILSSLSLGTYREPNDVLIGVVTTQVTNPPYRPNIPYALGAGRFDYNDPWFTTNAAWNPGFPLGVNSPIEDQIYDLDNIGNFD